MCEAVIIVSLTRAVLYIVGVSDADTQLVSDDMTSGAHSHQVIARK